MSFPLYTSGAGATTTGKIRTNNEDRFIVDTVGGWFAVADGIGGLPYGEKASECAIRTLVREAAANTGEPDLGALFARCHQAIALLGQILDPRLGIGTTLTCFHLREDQGYIAHVGDCVAYLQTDRNSPLRRLTTDHTVPSPPVAVNGAPFPLPPKLDRYLGQKVTPACDTLRFPVSVGNRIILCSDGITRVLDDDDIASVSQAQDSPASLANALVHIADLRGGLDNATSLVIDVGIV